MAVNLRNYYQKWICLFNIQRSRNNMSIIIYVRENNTGRSYAEKSITSCAETELLKFLTSLGDVGALRHGSHIEVVYEWDENSVALIIYLSNNLVRLLINFNCNLRMVWQFEKTKRFIDSAPQSASIFLTNKEKPEIFIFDGETKSWQSEISNYYLRLSHLSTETVRKKKIKIALFYYKTEPEPTEFSNTLSNELLTLIAKYDISISLFPCGDEE